jgi:hypothetical protein
VQMIIVETYVETSLEKCFDAASDIDLHTRTVWRHTHEEAIDGVKHVLIHLGESVTFKATHFGIRQKLTSKIVEYDRPNLFVDEMQKGAFKRMKHTHEFKQQGKGIVMKDILEFQSPYGIVGILFDVIVLKYYMKKFVKDRNNQLKIFLEES